VIIKSTKPFRVPLSEPATVGTRVKNMMGSTGVVTLYVSLFTLECDEICTSVWGCGRRRAAPAKSQEEQRTEKWPTFPLLRLNYLSEQHFGKVAMRVSSFCPDIFKIYLKRYVANTMKYTCHYAAASPLAAPPHTGTYNVTQSGGKVKVARTRLPSVGFRS